MDASEDAMASTFLQADEVDGSTALFSSPEISDDPIALIPGPRAQPDDTSVSELPQQLIGVEDGGLAQLDPIPAPPQRPGLIRNRSVPESAAKSDIAASVTASVLPADPNQPQDVDPLQDSLSLGQLKKLVAEMPKIEPTPYAFEYDDTSSFEEDIEELFGYSVEERASLLKAQRSFAKEWRSFLTATSSQSPSEQEERGSPYEDVENDWASASTQARQDFLKQLAVLIQKDDIKDVVLGLECVIYIVFGCWYETAGKEMQTSSLDDMEDGNLRSKGAEALAKEHRKLYKKAQVQVAMMKENIKLLFESIDFKILSGIPKHLFKKAQDRQEKKNEGSSFMGNVNLAEDERRSFWACISILYLIVEVARRNCSEQADRTLRDRILSHRPSLLNELTDMLSSLRWEDRSNFPLSKLLLLYWKTILLSFGGTKEAKHVKARLFKQTPIASVTGRLEPEITASPLDYHLFRQEITSKYPAFDPPPALFPFEPDSNSMLPPLQDWSSKTTHTSSGAGPANINGQGSSILHQPVHIATPAPSPPPSPAGPGGKGIKKQNYQTNQMLPFLYPPLEASSNDLGGKGSTEVQDLLVGRKWTGSDVPTSILEAADLFSSRMRATRAMKQLWKERVLFMKYERGYDSMDLMRLKSKEDGRDVPLNSNVHDEDMINDLNELDDTTRQILVDVEDFYQHILSRLQSIVVVLLKVLLQTVTTLVTQSSLPNGLQNGFLSSDFNGSGGILDGDEKAFDRSLQELDSVRSQEIMGKAVSAILLLLLKWFKLSHILKCEYLTQLLLDSNYVQLILKLFTHQELERVVSVKCEQRSLNFFEFCTSHSRNVGLQQNEAADADDDAAPPSIKKQREPVGDTEDEVHEAGVPPAPPEVDELGYPISAVPETPITNFSWRAFFSSINYLRVLQKVVKSKQHRQFLMAQYKYSNILKKALKVPQKDVRLYTLKVIKGQIPHCHRKWRQGNMRVITAIYLHCRPNLRDEWLMSPDAEQEVGEAMPAEQALRSLTYWYNLRRYPDQMGLADGKSTGPDGRKLDGKGVLEEDQDFFLRELEKMEIAMDRSSDDLAYEDEEFLQQPSGVMSDIGILPPPAQQPPPPPSVGERGLNADSAAPSGGANSTGGRDYGYPPPNMATWA